MAGPRSRIGAYGFELAGVPDAAHLLVDAPESWPLLTIVREPARARPAIEEVTDDHARLWLASGASAELERATARARLRLPGNTTDGAIVHPLSRARGADHGAAGSAARGCTGAGWWPIAAYGLCSGEKTAGKSTTLAAMALSGVGVVSDDVLVIDAGHVLAGPRSIDLRGEAARRFGVGEPLGRVGARERWRLPLAGVASELPLKGWITLAWGEAIAIDHLRGAERLAALLPHRGVRLAPTMPNALLRDPPLSE